MIETASTSSRETADTLLQSVTARAGEDLPPELLESPSCELQCLPAREAYPVLRQPPRQPNTNGMVARLDAYFGNVRVGVCIDTGAINSLISKKIWQQIKYIPGVVENIRPPILTMRGGSGDAIPLDGLAHVCFKLSNFVYEADIHFGGLNGIDMLLGWDWLWPMKAQVDCGAQTVTIGPQQSLHFLDGAKPCYITTTKTTVIPSRHAGCVECRLSGSWFPDTPAVVTAMVSIQQGVDLVEQVVQPDESGMVYLVFHNESLRDCTIPVKEIVGELKPLDVVTQQNSSIARRLSTAMWSLPEGGTADVATLYEGPDQASSYWAAGQLICGETSATVTDDLGELPDEKWHSSQATGSSSKSKGDLLEQMCHYAASEQPGYDGSRSVLLATARVWDEAGNDTLKGRCGVPWREARMNMASGSSPSSRALNVESEMKTFRVEKSLMAGCLQPVSPITRLPEHLQCTLPADGSGLSADELNQAVDLVLEFADIFVGPDGEVGFSDKIRHRVDMPSAKPIKISPRKKSEECITTEVKKLHQDGKVVPSQSPFGAPVILLRKKDGTLHFCIDYRQVNDMKKKDPYPLPRIEEYSDTLNGIKFFSTMDLAGGYLQVAMDAKSQPNTAFTTHVEHFEWNVIPIKLCRSSAILSRLMEQVFTNLCWTKCLVHSGEVLAIGTCFQEALENLRAVFQRFRDANLKLKANKCKFFSHQAEYLGHQVMDKGIRPSPSMIHRLQDMALPTNLTEVRKFLGLTGYYRRFVKNYSHLAAPLTNLTKKGVPFLWSMEQDKAFHALKEALELSPLLHYVQSNVPFILDTDTSNVAIGAVLSQEHDGIRVPLAYGSKTLCNRRRNYCTTKRELYAIVYFMQYFQGYIRGSRTIIVTDHSAWTWLMGFSGSDAMYHRWVIQMKMYPPWRVLHRPGYQHEDADLLSRIRRDCQYTHCAMCKEHFRKNAQCHGTESEDTELEASGARQFLTWEERAQLALQVDPEEGDDRPDLGDYPLGESDSRKENYGVVFKVSSAEQTSQELVITRARAKQTVAQSAEQLEKEELQREAQVRHWKMERAAKCKQVATRRSARLTEMKKSRKPVNPTLPPKQQPQLVPASQVGGKKRRRGRPRKKKVKKGSVETSDHGVDVQNGRELKKKQLVKKLVQGGEECVDNSKNTPSANPREEISLQDNSSPDSIGESSEEEESGTLDASHAPKIARSPKVYEHDTPEYWDVEDSRTLFPERTQEVWIAAQKADPVLRRFVDLLLQGTQPSPSSLRGESTELQLMASDWSFFVLADGILCRRVPARHIRLGPTEVLQRVVPAEWRVDIFRRVHCDECRHMGYDRVYAMLWSRFYWPGMSTDVLEFLRACSSCQQNKPGCGRGRMPLKQDQCNGPMVRVGMDIAYMKLTSEGYRYLLVVQDYYSKYIELYPLKEKSAAAVATVLVNEFLTRYGACGILHSDQGREFDCELIKEVCKLWGIEKSRTSPFAPWSNGMVERSNRTIKQMLRQMCNDHWADNWVDKLPFIRLAMNSTVHSSTSLTPYKVFNSRCDDPILPLDLLYGAPVDPRIRCDREYIMEQKLKAREVASVVESALNKAAQSQQKDRERGGLKVREYAVGDMVWRWWPPHANDKMLSNPFAGPYKVLGVRPQDHTILLRVPRAAGGFQEKWINVGNVKPVRYTKDGLLLVVLPPDLDPGSNAASDWSPGSSNHGR